MKKVKIEKMNVTVDGKSLWAVIDEDGHTMFQVFSVKEPVHILDMFNEKELV